MLQRVVYIFLLFPIGVFAQSNTWMQRDSVKGPAKSACVAFTAYTSGFVGLGFDLTENKRSFYRYDPGFDDWDQIEYLGNASGAGLERSSAVAFSIYNMGYVGLGQGFNPYFDDFWKYDPGSDVWTQMADFGGSGRTMAVGFAIDSLGYVGTGKDASGFKNDFWKYSPATNTWVQITSFPGTPRRLAVGITMGGYGYVGTGDDGTFKNDFYRYNPSTNSWAPIAAFGGTARYGATGFARYPSLFVGTGYDNTLNYKNDIWEFNFWTGTWTQRAAFPGTPRSNAIGFCIGLSGYIGTGYDGDLKDDFYEYTIPLSVNEENTLHTFTVYPNPTNDYLHIQVNSEWEIEKTEVFDIQGKLILCETNYLNHQQYIRMPVSTLMAGTYICQLTGKTGEVARQKFQVFK